MEGVDGGCQLLERGILKLLILVYVYEGRSGGEEG